MSARVVNPFTITEMRRLREAVARPTAFRPEPESRARVCRNLWGKASAEDSRAFAAKELTEQRERAAKRWGFDFFREEPRTHGPGAERFKWTPVRIGTVPSAYKMPRLPRLANLDAVLETARATVPSLAVREQQPEATTTAEAATPLSAESSPVSSTLDLETSPDLTSPPASASTSTTSTPAPVRQTTMKDFLNVRKRPLSRKHEETPNIQAAKRPRHSELS